MHTTAFVRENAPGAPWCGADDTTRQLLSTWPYLPYLHCPGVSLESRVEYVLGGLTAARQRGAATLVASSDSQLQALAQWQLLPWDSEMLGFRAARISALYRRPSQAAAGCQQRILNHVLEEAQGQGVRYLLTRIPAGDVRTIQQVEGLGFRMVDGIVTFGAALTSVALEGAENVRPAVPGDIPVLRDIAGTSFLIDRFHSDPAISQEKADEVQRVWIENSCRGMADAVLIAEVDGKPAAFTTLKIDAMAERKLGIKIGIIELVATSPDYRRRGLGRNLCLASLHWFRQAGCDWVEVGTQIGNIQAARLYQSAGFFSTATSLTLRRLF
jgi:dTDP-4-amino-4,6-dideoxy-D-galactose acyltransferase